MENDELYMKSLYERFRKEVVEGEQIDFYDREELLDIYDYAQDEGDIMVQLWVFLAAARQYPDADKFLGERMGFFVSYIDGAAGMDMLDRKSRRESPLWDVLRLSIADPSTINIEEEFDKILSRHEHLDSETVIKLVDFLRNQKSTDILGKNLKLLKKKAEDLSGLEFEVAAAMFDTGTNLDEAARISEELTESEPFNIDNWILLSKIEIGREHFAEGMAAADYALAIDPDFFPAKVLSAVGQSALPESRNEGIVRLKELLSQDSSDPVATKALVMALEEENRTEEAADAYLQYWRTNVETNGFVFADIIRLKPAPEKLDEAFGLFMTASKRQEDMWIQIAAALSNEGNIEMALAVLEYYQENEGLHRGVEMLMMLYYQARRWDDVCSLFNICCHTNDLFRTMQKTMEEEKAGEKEDAASAPGKGVAGADSEVNAEINGEPDENSDIKLPFQFSLTAFLLYAAASLMARDYATAQAMAQMMLSSPPTHDNLDDRIRIRGILQNVQDILNWAKRPATIPTTPDFWPIR